ncbi:galactokinase [Tropicimonas aquimaris]|uniref:Galactokinase n=1 Tax=Tropicimonas aquimaris TaxID=914152 RepID=A0ABW3IS43_9RHOB
MQRVSNVTDEELLVQVSNAFEAAFGCQPGAVAFAPGRVNLLGEHTDYTGGLAMPMPLNLGVAVAVGPGSEPGLVEFVSETLSETDRRRADDPPAGRWSDYMLGCLQAVASEEIARDGCHCAVSATLPVGAGLSSSAAVEVATLRAANALLGREDEPGELARIALKVENDYVGVPCGIMDQVAASAGVPGLALLLDTRTLDVSPIRLPYNHHFVVVHSGVSHRLALDAYSERVAECARAASELGVADLGELSLEDLGRAIGLAEPLGRRVRHVVTENERVRAGVADLEAGAAAAFGRRMIESHLSQRDDFEVSIARVDALVDGAMRSGALGARLTGGGFGGAIVALVRDVHLDAFCASIRAGFPEARVLAVA